MNLQEDSKLDPMSGRRWIVVATFSADALGTPFVDELALVSTDKHWLLDDTGVPRRIPPPLPPASTFFATGPGGKTRSACTTRQP